MDRFCAIDSAICITFLSLLGFPVRINPFRVSGIVKMNIEIEGERAVSPFFFADGDHG